MNTMDPELTQPQEKAFAFLLQSPQFSPQRARGASIGEPSEESKMADSTSEVEASTRTDFAIASSVYSKLIEDLPLDPCPVSSPHQSESDPTGLSASVAGAKLDKGKVDVWSGAIDYFPRALEAIARVSEVGARKYSWKGWEKVADGFRRYSAAMMRHIVKESKEEIDIDTGLFHVEQTAWNAMARLELFLREKEKNDK